MTHSVENGAGASVDQQAMWNALGILGFDLDGDKTPAATLAGMGDEGFRDYFLECIKEARRDYDAALDEMRDTRPFRAENDVRLTDAEREALDVMGMFPTSKGFARPSEWEQETEVRLVRTVESIIAARLRGAVIPPAAPATERGADA